MKTAVTDEDEAGYIVYNRSLVALAKHYGFLPRACRPYQAKTKGKVERPFSYIQQDFFLARSFSNLDDLNAQLRVWLDSVANVRLHGTTQRIISETYAAKRPELQPLPATPFDALLKLERRVSHDGFVSISGNYYSVPDRTRRVVEVHQLPDAIRILDGGRLVATHTVLEGQRQYRVDPNHRQGSQTRAMRHGHQDSLTISAGAAITSPSARSPSIKPSARAWPPRLEAAHEPGSSRRGRHDHRQHQAQPRRPTHASRPGGSRRHAPAHRAG